ncbi:MAG: S46 family peptidase [Bacteroidales bacterium]|jgi:hypothetical protein|nr:S46 family peptidase [Bacteroidales bacterium]
MKRKFNLLLIVSLFLFGKAVADEGMWLPSLIHKLNINDMQQMGFKLNAEDVYSINNSSLKDAVAALDRGSCTAELISNEGLLLTNHHCGFDEIQKHSSVENDYLRDGFWAQSKNQELPNPDKTVTFLIRMENVTGKVLSELNDTMSEDERNRKIREISLQLEREAVRNTHYETYVRSFFNSNEFYLFVTETFMDVRLVGAPPQSLGKFGGDTDNWMWPRHTGDFCLFRVYCGPDGKPAQYSEENIPYQPKYFLPVSLKGIEEGDFAMVMGYPGTTNRYKTSYGVDYTMQVTNPVRIEVREKKLDIIGQYMKMSQKTRIQYASKYARSSNYYKHSIGQNQSLESLNVISKKKELEEEFTAWVNADSERKNKYGDALQFIAEAYSDNANSHAQDYIVEALISGPEIFMFAIQMQPFIEILKNPEKNNGLTENFIVEIKEKMKSHFKDYDASIDQKLAGELMKLYSNNNAVNYNPAFFAEVQKKYRGDFSKYTEKMFSKTIFADSARMNAFIDNPSLKTIKNDMAFEAAIQIYNKYIEINSMVAANSVALSKGNRLFVEGLMEMDRDKNFYPDANSTMRLTYGQVLDYEPRDGVTYKYYTTTKGYIEKEIPGDHEFDVPTKMKEMILANDFGRYADKDGNLHACFITNNDITGGNSGSPVINGKGELIGIAFDGNWEAMSGDLIFEPELQRCINVDIRFVLWVIDKYAGAKHLINEMKIVE